MGVITSRVVAHRGYSLTGCDPNSRAALEEAVLRGFGVETDLRDALGELVVSHDPPDDCPLPFSSVEGILGESQGVLALNVKSDGLSPLLVNALKSLPEGRAFFFDMSWPETVALSKLRLPIALRVSEWEPLDMTLFEALAIPVRVWLDGFESDWWIDDSGIQSLLQRGQVVLVSPEIHGRAPYVAWAWARKAISEGSDLYVCTDLCDELSKALSE